MIIKVKVKTNSNEQEIIKQDDFYLVKLKSLPVKGKANLELLRIIRKYFNAKEVKIKSGFTNKNKLIEIIN